MVQPTFTGVAWHSHCNGGNCVEVAYQDGWVGVRDGKDGGTGPMLTFTTDEWDAFVQGVKDGRFDRA
ncbi:DUF397 domain-containing protein [Microbispora sp. ATCC PTA-5024]|uniref:DUF397 domain-containing protein n=1 Tax=Microbispora sp. ATCC PTA-5024 TaxID=316330 RepID=UPI0003DB6D8A|nr:DUF397 domain-containing protein [Microbispora sp. ATCC PTA-5024]ETK33766.1 hypothetical protein MPTA5024_22790 [Microbispora sp. ATCC PTA-5024]